MCVRAYQLRVMKHFFLGFEQSIGSIQLFERFDERRSSCEMGMVEVIEGVAGETGIKVNDETWHKKV